jgi:hypothetical protein
MLTALSEHARNEGRARWHSGHVLSVRLRKDMPTPSRWHGTRRRTRREMLDIRVREAQTSSAC